MNVIQPHWPVPSNVRSAQTLRSGGVSAPPYTSLNLGTHVGDNLADVQRNRALLASHLDLSNAPVWLEQVHGTGVVTLPLSLDATATPVADAVLSRTPGQVCAIMTADCLPVLFCDTAGTVVAAAHAGWRGLANGVLEATLQAMNVAPATVMVWLGPAIGPSAFEVGGEVRAAFIAHSPLTAAAFVAHSDKDSDKWLADIYQLARLRLAAAGVTQCYGGGYCTYTDSERFFSYRREPKIGRQASLIWLE
ncbi:peptidoglycan editing factor PgeF [Oceanisphaera sp. IT1-181]|uniref:peptidoglycan editing factor PgeF n=1 Tax=Oceanisphaera sp. IT1-181 TaxID=3081199 RepID=UPI0029CA6033|nr:peptidoglycan editing factor PgeF [Oceanisphaera sp. IT1-181]